MRFALLIVALLIVAYASAETKDKDRLDSLYVNVEQSVNTPSFLGSIDQLHEAARALEDLSYEELACNAYIYYYYMNVNMPKVSYWYDRLEHIVRQTKHYRKLFFGKYMFMRLYDLEGEQGSAFMEIDNAYQMALSLDDPFCLRLSYLGFANLYLKAKQYDEASDMVSLALPQGAPTSAHTPLEALALSLRANISLLQGKEEELLECLDNLENYLANYDGGYHSGPGGNDIPFMYFVSRYTVWLMYARHYIRTGDMEKAESYMRLIDRAVENSSNINHQLSRLDVYVEYYLATNDRENALKGLDKTLSLVRQVNSGGIEVEVLHKKARLLSSMGEEEAALGLYARMASLKDSVNRDVYARQIGKFYARLKAKSMEDENRMLKDKKQLLHYGFLSLLVFCLLLVITLFIFNKLRRDLKLAKAKEEESERLKSMFLANMNHEIRTPLNAITGFCDLLSDETDPDTCEMYTGIIRNNNEQLYRLINDVLDISKIESGTMDFCYSEVSLPELMRGLLQSTRLRVEGNVAVTLDPIEDISLWTDKGRLLQVLSNFLTNALKYTDSGTICFGYETQEETVRFYVTDTGRGIPESEQENIFTRFVQGEGQKGGVGLGLALCKGIVQHMGGDIGVVSKVGEGSTFWFTLPINAVTSK